MLDWDAIAAGRNNYTSPADQCRVYRLLYRGEILTPELRETAMDFLRRQRHMDGLMRYIPDNITVAHKGRMPGLPGPRRRALPFAAAPPTSWGSSPGRSQRGGETPGRDSSSAACPRRDVPDLPLRREQRDSHCERPPSVPCWTAPALWAGTTLRWWMRPCTAWWWSCWRAPPPAGGGSAPTTAMRRCPGGRSDPGGRGGRRLGGPAQADGVAQELLRCPHRPQGPGVSPGHLPPGRGGVSHRGGGEGLAARPPGGTAGPALSRTAFWGPTTPPPARGRKGRSAAA